MELAMAAVEWPVETTHAIQEFPVALPDVASLAGTVQSDIPGTERVMGANACTVMINHASLAFNAQTILEASGVARAL